MHRQTLLRTLTNLVVVLALLLNLLPASVYATSAPPPAQTTDPPPDAPASDAPAPDAPTTFLPVISKGAGSGGGPNTASATTYLPVVANNTAITAPAPAPTPPPGDTPPADAVESVINADGGQLIASNGHLTLDVPAGAVAAETVFRQWWRRLDKLDSVPTGHFALFHLEAQDLKSEAPIDAFKAPLLLTLYLQDLVPADVSFHLLQRNATTFGWEVVAGPLLLGKNGEVQVELTRIGDFALNAAVASTISAEGGQLVTANGFVALDVPKGAVAADTVFRQWWEWAEPLDPTQAGNFLLFELTAHDAQSGAPIEEFKEPLLLTLRISELVPAKESFYLLHWNKASNRWEATAGPLTLNSNGEVQVVLTHLSAFTLSTYNPAYEGWKLLFNDANVGLFNGSAAYRYPIEVPPGPHSLQPDLALSYNSSRVSGLTSWVQSDWVGLGWSLDTVEIVREVTVNRDPGGVPYDADNQPYGERCNNIVVVCFNRNFTLLFHGTSYRLVPDPTDTTSYHTEDESFLRIRRVPCVQPECTNQGGPDLPGGPGIHDYWKVTAQDGTVYRLGAHEDSEQRIGHACQRFVTDPLRCIQADRKEVVYRWRLDQVTDVYNNEIRYRYVETKASDQGYGLINYYNAEFWDRESYLSEISYGWNGDSHGGYRVIFDLICRNGAPTLSGPCSTDDTVYDAPGEYSDAQYGNSPWTLWFQRKVLHAIRVMQGDTLIREYDFAYGDSGDRAQHDCEPPHDTTICWDNSKGIWSRVLTKITMYGQPAKTQFVYEAHDTLSHPSAPNNPSNCTGPPTYPYGRLKGIDNGYGAMINLVYHPDITQSNPGCSTPQMLFNYRVVEKTVEDGINPALHTRYDYDQPCYRLPNAPDDLSCNSTNPAGLNRKILIGYGKVTVTERSITNSDATEVSKSEHRFFPDDADWNLNSNVFSRQTYALIGREKIVRQLDENDQIRKETVNVYTATLLIDQADPIWDVIFVHADEVIQSEYDSNGTTLLAQTRSATAYRNDIGKPIAQYNYGETRTVKNGSFEAVRPNGKPKDWTVYNFLNNPSFTWSTTSIVTATALGGSSLALTYNSGSGNCDCGLYQDVTQHVHPNTGYRVYARVRAASNPGPNFNLLVFDGQNGNNVVSTSVQPTTTWQLVTVDFTTTDIRKLHIRVGFGADINATDTLYVDDVWYEPLSATGDEKTAATWYSRSIDNVPPPSMPPDWTTNNVVVPITQRVYAGVDFVQDGRLRWEDSWLSMTRLIYDSYNPDGGETWRVKFGTLTAQEVYHTQTGDWSNPQYYYTTRFTYDQWGNQTHVIDPLNGVTKTGYDNTYHTYPVTVTNALNQVTTMRYNHAFGKVERVTDPNGLVTEINYDPFGRLTSVNEDGATTLTYTYTDAYVGGGLHGLRIETTRYASPNANHTYEFYSGRGLLMQTRSELNQTEQSVTNVGYDGAGRVILNYAAMPEPAPRDQYTLPNPNGPRTTTAYDRLGRPVTVIGPDRATQRTVYRGREVATLSANNPEATSNQQVIRAYDAFGQLVQVREYTDQTPGPNWDPNAAYATTNYHYDPLGNLVTVVDNAGHTTQMTYNKLGWKTAMDDPDMGDWRYSYDPLGRLLTQTDANGATLGFVYDALGRVTRKLFREQADAFDVTLATMTYDHAATFGIGRRRSLVDANGTHIWGYDRRGRVVGEGQAINGVGAYVTGYTYNSANQLTQINYPTGESVNIGYDNQWLPNSLTSAAAGAIVSTARYNARGQMLGMDMGNGTHAGYAYAESGCETQSVDCSLRLFEAGVLYANEPRLSRGYTYDLHGNLTHLVDGHAGWAEEQLDFTYDALNRLTGVTIIPFGGVASSEAYGYDELGNLTSMGGRTYSYSAAHPHAVISTSDGGLFGYDANGNMTKRTEQINGELVTFGQDWNAENQLVSISKDTTGETWTQLYDGDGQRVGQVDPNGLREGYFTGGLVEDHTLYGENLDDGAAQNWTVYGGAWSVQNGKYVGNNIASTDVVTVARSYISRPQAGATTLTWSMTFMRGVTGGLNFFSSTLGRENSYLVRQDGSKVIVFRAHTINNNIVVDQLIVFDAANAVGQTHHYQVTIEPALGRLTVWRDTALLGGVTDNYEPRLTGGSYLFLVANEATIGFDDIRLGQVTTYYTLGSQRVAMRKAGISYYLHGDHLGSTSMVTCGSQEGCGGLGAVVAQSRYKPFGDVRENEGVPPTDFGFTGQRLVAGFGLIHMGARWYDPLLGRWTSADAIVPEMANPQTFNRYTYTLNNPLRYTDPTGHFSEEELREYFSQWYDDDKIDDLFAKWQKFSGEWWDVLMQADFGDYVEGGGNGTWHVGRFYKNQGKIGFDWLDYSTSSLPFENRAFHDAKFQYDRFVGPKQSNLHLFYEWGGAGEGEHLEEIILGRPQENTAAPSPDPNKLVAWARTGLAKAIKYVWQLDSLKAAAADPKEIIWLAVVTFPIYANRDILTNWKGYALPP